MKYFFFLLLCSVSLAAIAQLPDAELKKITEKNLHLLQQADPQKMHLQSPVVVPVPEVLTLPQDCMPYVVPNTKNLERIPNPLPELKIPDVAAIPNPALRKDLQMPAIIQTPGSK